MLLFHAELVNTLNAALTQNSGTAAPPVMPTALTATQQATTAVLHAMKPLTCAVAVEAVQTTQTVMDL